MKFFWLLVKSARISWYNQFVSPSFKPNPPTLPMKLKTNQIRLPGDIKHNRVDLTDRMKAVGIFEPLGAAGKQYLETVYKKKHDEALAESVLIRAREEDHRSI